MLENLKSLEIFKNVPAVSSNSVQNAQFSQSYTKSGSSSIYPQPIMNQSQPSMPRPYVPTHFAGFPFPTTQFDHRRFYALGEFYLNQQLERSSAFQYVQANHLRHLENVAGSFLHHSPLVPVPILPIRTK